MLAITDATIYTVTKGIISKGAVLFKGGKVLDVGNDVKIPEGCPVICGRGKIVTPGLIDSHSQGICNLSARMKTEMRLLILLLLT